MDTIVFIIRYRVLCTRMRNISRSSFACRPLPSRETVCLSHKIVPLSAVLREKWLEFYCPVRLRNGGRTNDSFSCSPTCVRSRTSTSLSPRTLAKTRIKHCSLSDWLLSKGCVSSWQTTVQRSSRAPSLRLLYRVSPRPLRFWTRGCLTVEYHSSPSKNVSI